MQTFLLLSVPEVAVFAERTDFFFLALFAVFDFAFETLVGFLVVVVSWLADVALLVVAVGTVLHAFDTLGYLDLWLQRTAFRCCGLDNGALCV